MDNLTHTLLGAALARTRLGRLSPYATPALVVGANLPDLDVLVRLWAGKGGYLVHHRGITHALPGIVLQALLLAVAVRWLERRRERGASESRGSWRGALTIAAVALASHPLLDLLNVYGLRPWLPFDPRWVYGDVAFIVDPWLWLAFGAGALLAGPASWKGHFWWTLLFALGAAAIGAAAVLEVVPWAGAALWFAGLVALATGRARGWGRRAPGRTLGVSFAAAGLYLAALAALGPLAQTRGRALVEPLRPAGEPVLEVTHAPSPLDPLRWSVLVETERAVYVADLHLAGGQPATRRLARLQDDPRVRAALDSDCAAAWRSFVRHPHAGLIETEEGTWVELMDARYQRSLSPSPAGSIGEPPPVGTWCSAVVRVDASGRVDCAP